jgi:hypothetical protein
MMIITTMMMVMRFWNSRHYHRIDWNSGECSNKFFARVVSKLIYSLEVRDSSRLVQLVVAFDCFIISCKNYTALVLFGGIRVGLAVCILGY